MVSILLLMFGLGYEVESYDYEARFGQDFKFKFSRDADLWLRL